MGEQFATSCFFFFFFTYLSIDYLDNKFTQFQVIIEIALNIGYLLWLIRLFA